ncbi:arginase family protein [Synergistaceae bacterium OttesenSCG-928-I11]|nr:arginase family protein [Synergistaceae bacterium OttesenSCG-928-I11]
MEPQQRFSGCDASPGDACMVVYSPAYDGEAPGSAIRTASTAMETYSPYQRTDLSEVRVHDAGDLVLPSGDIWKAIDTIEAYSGKRYDEDRTPVMIASEHALSYGAIRAAAARYPDLHVVHFGAHADLKKEHNGATLATRTVMRRVWDLLGDRRIYQFGVRSGSREEFEWGVPPHVRMEHLAASSIDSCAEAVGCAPLYITVDLSVVDPSGFPGTKYPNAGGVSFPRLHDALMSFDALDVVGFDICGLFPGCDDGTGSSAALAYKLLREMLIAYA